MVTSEVAVVIFAVLSTGLLLARVDEALSEVLANGASQPLRLAIHSASRGELAGDAAKKAGAVLLSHILKRQLGTFVIFNFVVSMYALSVVLTKAIFLGPLSPIEAGKLSERMLKFLMLKLVFVAAVCGPEMQLVAIWVSWFAVVGWLKMFVGLARDRFDTLISSPSATLISHIRTLALLIVIFVNDIACIVFFMRNKEKAPLSHISLWLFDTIVAALEAAAIMVKYGVYVSDQLNETHGWEGKGDFLYKVELAADMAVKSLTLSHLTHIWWLRGVPLLTVSPFRLLDAILFLDIRHLFWSIRAGLRRYWKYQSALNNINHRFADVSKEVLDREPECTICREKMKVAKILPCGHIFHLTCLTSWMQQSGSDNFTCPLCRMPLFTDALANLGDGGDQVELDGGGTEHDVEVSTFSSQVVGQALTEAARSLSEGNALLRQNWAAELNRLEMMVHSLRQRMQANLLQLQRVDDRGDRSQAAQTEAPAPSLVREPSLDVVEALERQLDDLREVIEGSSLPTEPSVKSWEELASKPCWKQSLGGNGQE